jgi:hypothetical protein
MICFGIANAVLIGGTIYYVNRQVKKVNEELSQAVKYIQDQSEEIERLRITLDAMREECNRKAAVANNVSSKSANKTRYTTRPDKEKREAKQPSQKTPDHSPNPFTGFQAQPSPSSPASAGILFELFNSMHAPPPNPPNIEEIDVDEEEQLDKELEEEYKQLQSDEEQSNLNLKDQEQIQNEEDEQHDSLPSSASDPE